MTSRVAYGGERILLEKNGKRIAALVAIEDVQLLEAIEDKIDIEEAKKALKRGKFISISEARKKLRL